VGDDGGGGGGGVWSVSVNKTRPYPSIPGKQNENENQDGASVEARVQ
jgi:hypothetical protein